VEQLVRSASFYLVRDDGEVPCRAPGLGCDNGGIQSQKLGLVGDLVDDRQDIADGRCPCRKGFNDFGGGPGRLSDLIHTVDDGLYRILSGSRIGATSWTMEAVSEAFSSICLLIRPSRQSTGRWFRQTPKAADVDPTCFMAAVISMIEELTFLTEPANISTLCAISAMLEAISAMEEDFPLPTVKHCPHSPPPSPTSYLGHCRRSIVGRFHLISAASSTLFEAPEILPEMRDNSSTERLTLFTIVFRFSTIPFSALFSSPISSPSFCLPRLSRFSRQRS
jgi:hypothetical protein